MAWFGRKSGREESRPALSRVETGSWRVARVVNGAAAYEAAVRQSYLANAVAQRAVKLMAESVGGAPVDASDPGLAGLVTRCLLETVAAQVLLHGNAFVEVLTGEDANGSWRPDALFALRPERVTVEIDAVGWPAGYRYKVGERVVRVPPERMIHVRAYNPVDDHYGASCLAAAVGAVEVHNAASAWHKALLANAARPSGALVYDPGDGSVLSPEQFARLKEEMAGAFQGMENAGRPMLLEGGLRWQALSLSPADMDFAGTKAAAAREIALAFGVPPMLLGLPGDSTHANYKEANKALWRMSVLPLADAILRALTDGLGAWFPGATLAVDLDRVPALVEDRERLWRMVAAADFITTDEKRQMVGWS